MTAIVIQLYMLLSRGTQSPMATLLTMITVQLFILQTYTIIPKPK